MSGETHRLIICYPNTLNNKLSLNIFALGGNEVTSLILRTVATDQRFA